MTRQSNKGTGVLFSPEFREIVRRLDDSDPDLIAVIGREDMTDAQEDLDLESRQAPEGFPAFNEDAAERAEEDSPCHTAKDRQGELARSEEDS